MDDRFIKYDLPDLQRREIPFKKFDKVNYKGANGMRPYNGTYIWSVEIHDVSPSFVKFIIEHPDGFPPEHFIVVDDEFGDMFVDELKAGLCYVYADAGSLELVEPYVAKK